MKRRILLSLLCIPFFSLAALATTRTWQVIPNHQVASQGSRVLFPSEYSSFYLNTAALKSSMIALGGSADKGMQFELPSPDGSMRTFTIWQTPMMEAPLAAKYPEIKTFTGYASDNKGVTIKLDFTYKGFHAMVFEAGNTYFIDPYSNENDGFYVCYYKKNYPRPAGKYLECMMGSARQELGVEEASLTETGLPPMVLKINGTTKKEYRLALACTIEYAVAVAGTNLTKANVLSAMVTSMNRVNGVYERELAVTMILVANTDTLIYLSGTDPYSNNNGGTMLNENQTNVNAIIGAANYDIGHVFSTGGGGIAFLGCVCNNGSKARGVTGSTFPVGDPFDVDYVAHEMGHQFGSDHTFNANSSACSNNGVSSMAYEPGGGTTIMAYAGICGTIDNIQNNSDDYFHAASLDKISTYITTGVGGTCPTQIPVANNPPVIAPFTTSYAIPFNTPFELTAPAVTDNDHESLTYCWEQWNRGNFRSSWNNANLLGPIYRSFDPSVSPTRVFTTLPMLLANTINYKGEKLPEDSRFLTFRLTVRDMVAGIGTFNFADDTVHLDVINTGTPFKVTAPTTVVTWMGNSSETITWDVSGTDVAPINATTVDIYLSTDGGYTYPYQLASNTLNDGSETIIVPNTINTNTARVKVKASGNVFFDLSDVNFTIAMDLSNLNELNKQKQIAIYPIPARDVLHIETGLSNFFSVIIYNSIGQTVWSGILDKEQNISVSSWAKGVYHAQFVDDKSKESTVKKIIVE
ncbi:MAG TPA: zinc-dependent metalloprotease family protein [Flavipsychrobacter sp.]|nr:zinc-dependent metalloprotease family protein [Flavipsychrobacter sp.]